MTILFVEPNFPIPKKSKNHSNFFPIGLLKLYNYYKSLEYKVKLVRGNLKRKQIGTRFKPNKIMITSLFTYWSKYVKDSVFHYKLLFPKAQIIVGGIYASLMPEHCKEYTHCDSVYTGIHVKAERYALNNGLNYQILNNPHPIDYQILHASRGCDRRCEFCGTWKIEPKCKFRDSVKDQIQYKKLIFYDNDFLANPNIENILNELIIYKKNKKILWCESQSGFDGRKLLSNPKLGVLIRKAGFRYPRIAWDSSYNQYPYIKKQIDILCKSGYSSQNIYIFMLYNWNIPFNEMEKKRLECWKWKVQIADCRFRPLTQTFDNYNPQIIRQTTKDYYIHNKANWTDELIKQFRKNVRRQNICVRHNFFIYSKDLEQNKISQSVKRTIRHIKNYKKLSIQFNKKHISWWYPGQISYPGFIDKRRREK